MLDFLSGYTFRFFVLPLITVALTMIIRICSKRDSMHALEKEDFAIGPNLITTSIFILVSKMSMVALAINSGPTNSKQGTELLAQIFIWAAIMFVGLIIMIAIVRTHGWTEDKRTNRMRLKYGTGIIFPDIVGFAYLVLAFTMNCDIPLK